MLDLEEVPAAAAPPPAADLDPVAAHYCKTLEQVQGEKYDVVVVGGGAVGAAVADALVRKAGPERALRVLVLEKGPFLLPEHVQNLAPQYQRLIAKAVAKPWKLEPGTTFDLAPQVPYIGGRALFWSTWIPRPTRKQMPGWPERVLKELDEKRYWEQAERLMGAVRPSRMGPEFTAFQPRLLQRLLDRLGGIDHFLPYDDPDALEVPLASKATASTLGYRKFSPVPVLLAAAEDFPGRIDLVTGCEVKRIGHTRNGRLRTATALETTRGALDLKGARLVLANGVVEPTGLLLGSFPDELPGFAGTNLGGHVASWFSARVPRHAWKGLGKELQIGCAYLKGRVEAYARDFHVHLMGASNPEPAGATADLYRLIPDSFDQEFLAQLSSPDHIGFLVHCLGEWRSEQGSATGSRVRVDGGETVLAIKPAEKDRKLRAEMDAAALRLVKEVLAANVPEKEIEYWRPGTATEPGGWQPDPPAGRLKDALVHESGTLWMGEDPQKSVTTLDCRLHGVDNLYVGGAATFPTSGSWNPTLAAVALGHRLADHLLEGGKS
ncbi:GMC oxidoreductase [Nocardiopsis potens]|uniref:GMC oxidoreductase n=1 Tax=Nocardiopsis potens TaxID=1246458 RepID=UPI00037FFB2F|nr:GMC oxidoreductase [Nocardiopsis potens]